MSKKIEIALVLFFALCTSLFLVFGFVPAVTVGVEYAMESESCSNGMVLTYNPLTQDPLSTVAYVTHSDGLLHCKQ
jgi:hypothetical protein